MALPENRQKVLAIMKELEPEVIGKTHQGFTCNCGAVHCAPAAAVSIEPAGDSFPGQEVFWYLWHVNMKPEEGAEWSCGLSEFVETDRLERMFKHYFGEYKFQGNKYDLDIDGADRVREDLPAAVRISENDHQVRFVYSWGREQDTAIMVHRIAGKKSRLLASDVSFPMLISLLEEIEAEVYRGGPDPELPFESIWHTDYEVAIAQAHLAKEVFFQNIGSSTAGYSDQYVLTGIDIVFAK